MAAWGAAGFILAAVNPNGIDMWKIPFQTVGVITLQNLINEWASPDFHQPVQQLMLVLLFGTFAAVGLSRRRLSGSDLVSMVIFGYLALTARRNFGPFALVTAPILSKHLADLMPAWKNKLEKRWGLFRKITEFQSQSERDINSRFQAIINGSAVLLLCVLAFWKLIYVTDPDLIQKTEKEMFPRDAVIWLKEENPSGRLFNSYNWGGYFAWNLRDYPVFVDGRTDLFGDEILGRYVDVLSGREGWEKILSDYDVDILFIEADSTIEKLAAKSGWVINYKDQIAAILVRQTIIDK